MRRDLSRLLFGSSASKACLLVFELGLAASLGAKAFGLFSIAFAMLLSMAILLLLGLQFGVVNRVSVYLGRGEPAKAGAVLVAAVAFVSGLGAAAGILIGLNADWISSRLFGKPELAPYLLGVAWALPAEMINLTVSANLRGRRQFIAHSIVADGARNLGLLALLGISLRIDTTLTSMLHWWLLASWLGTLPGVAYLLRDAVMPSPANLRTGTTSLFGFSAWLGLWAVFQQAGGRLQMVLAGAFLSTSALGALAVLLRLTQGMNFLQTVVNQVSGPRLARLIDARDSARLRQTFRYLSSLMAFMSGIMALLLIIFAEPLLALFGYEFAAYGAVLAPLVLAQLVNSGSGPAGQMLLHGEYHQRLLIISMMALALLVVMGTLLYPTMGISGFLLVFAAIAVATTLAKQRSVLAYFACHGATPTVLAAICINSVAAAGLAVATPPISIRMGLIFFGVGAVLILLTFLAGRQSIMGRRPAA